MEQTVEYKQFYLLDLFKFIAAIIIVGLHSSALIDINGEVDFWFFQYVGRIAVPIFFLISGFLFGKRQITLKGTIAFSKRILILYLFYFAINLPIIIYSFYITQNNILLSTIRLLKNLRNNEMVVVREH